MENLILDAFKQASRPAPQIAKRQLLLAAERNFPAGFLVIAEA